MSTNIYTTNQGIFQQFFGLMGNMVHGNLVRQIQYLKVENQILRSKVGTRVTTTASEKKRLIKYGLPLGGSIKGLVSIVTYSTFRRWVNAEAGNIPDKPLKKPHPKRTPQDIRELILRLARENNWGYTRILGELRKLGLMSISRSTVRNILKENGFDPVPKRGEDTWDAFIKRHFQTLWACDFFTKTVWTLLGPKTFHVLFFINVHTRKVHIAGITKHPNKRWVTQKAKTISFLFDTSKGKRCLVRDRDNKYPKEFDAILRKHRVLVRKIPYRSPNLNPYAEGFVGTIKRECLDHFIVFGEQHFKYLIKEYIKYYNVKRPHSAMGNMPLGRIQKSNGSVKCKSSLGGMIRHYYRE